MFKKILSSLAVMLFVCGINTGAQDIVRHRVSAGNTVNPKYLPAGVITSNIDLGSDERWGGYWDGTIDENISVIGVETVPEDYDVAICYPAGSAQVSGLTIEGMRFTFPSSDFIADVKIWMSTTLPVTPGDADIVVQTVNSITDIRNAADPFVEVRFDKPYKVNPAKDLYIGYSFKVTGGESENELYPVLVHMGHDVPNSFFLKYDGESGAWVDYSQYELGRLAMQVLVSGTQPENGATLKSRLGSYTDITGSVVQVPLDIQNTGTGAIKSLDLSIELNGESTPLQITPKVPLTGIGATLEYELEVNMPVQSGAYDLNVKIEKVNGVSNESETAASGKLYAVSKAVERIPFVEEFTAMWCGNCPRGFVALQKLRQDYGTDISLAAIHSDDAMDCSIYYKDILAGVTGVPMAYVDRYYLDADPYYGYTKPYGIKDIVESAKEIKPAAKVYAFAQLDGDILTAKSETRFMYSGDASDFGIAYVITENGMHHDSWRQANFYSGSTDADPNNEPLFDYWINEGKFVKGVIYDDVVIAAEGIVSGIEGSVPSEVTEGENNIHSVEFDLTKYEVIQDRKNLNLIALVIDKSSGTIVNSHSVALSAPAAIEDITASDDKTVTACYTADGRMVTAPQKGLNIIKYGDGTVRKVVIR